MSKTVTNATVQYDKEAQKKKILMLLPLALIPLLCCAFYATGGGKGKPTTGVEKVVTTGINGNLPNPGKTSPGIVTNKLAAYQLAMRDSMSAVGSRQKEMQAGQLFGPIDLSDTSHKTGKLNSSVITSHYQPNPNLAAIHNTVKHFEKTNTASQQPKGSYMYGGKLVGPGYNSGAEADAEVRRQQLADNPEYQLAMENMKKGNALLNKLMDDKTNSEKRTDVVLQDGKKDTIVEKIMKAEKVKPSIISELGAPIKQKSQNGFYGLGSRSEEEPQEGLSIRAAIHSEQTVISGSVVKVRLLEPMTMPNGITIPENSFIFGTAAVSGERMTINFSSVNYNNSIYPISFAMYDMDGIAGISIPSSVSRTAAKQAVGQSVGGANYNVAMSQNVGQQLAMTAAQSGIDATKSLLQKKAVVIQIHLKANYLVLLVQKKDRR